MDSGCLTYQYMFCLSGFGAPGRKKLGLFEELKEGWANFKIEVRGRESCQPLGILPSPLGWWETCRGGGLGSLGASWPHISFVFP